MAMEEAEGGDEKPQVNSVLLASFYLLGMGVVCNWVALMQCLDYLGTIFREYSPSRVLTAAYAAFDLLALTLLFFFGDSLWANKRSRMVVGYSLCMAATVMLPILDIVLLDHVAAATGLQAATKAYFAVWVVYSLVVGAASAIIGSVTYAQAAVFGPNYCHAFVCGRAASGLSCILVRVLTKAVLPDTFGGLRTSTLSFLCVAALIVFGCVVVATCVLPTHCTNASWQLPLGTAAAASLTGGCESLRQPLLPAAAATAETHATASAAAASITLHKDSNSLPQAGKTSPGATHGAARLQDSLLAPTCDSTNDPETGAPLPDAGPTAAPIAAHLHSSHCRDSSCDGSTASSRESSRRCSSSSSSSLGMSVDEELQPPLEGPLEGDGHQPLQARLHCNTAGDRGSAATPSDDLAAAAAAVWQQACQWPQLWQEQPSLTELPSASFAAAAAAAGDFLAFHGSVQAPINAHSTVGSYVASPSGRTLLPEATSNRGLYGFKQHSVLSAASSPRSMLLLPKHDSNSGRCWNLQTGQPQQQGFQQQQLARLAWSNDSAANCWAAVRRSNAYMVAMRISFFVPCFLFPAMLSPAAAEWPAVGSWYTVILVFAFQSGAVVGSALPIYPMQRPKTLISLLAWGQLALVPLTVAALDQHAGPLVLIGITFSSMVYGYHVASLVFCKACEGLTAAADVELVQGLLVLVLTAARLVGLLMSWIWG